MFKWFKRKGLKEEKKKDYAEELTPELKSLSGPNRERRMLSILYHFMDELSGKELSSIDFESIHPSAIVENGALIPTNESLMITVYQEAIKRDRTTLSSRLQKWIIRNEHEILYTIRNKKIEDAKQEFEKLTYVLENVMDDLRNVHSRIEENVRKLDEAKN